MYSASGDCQFNTSFFIYKMHTEMGQSRSPIIRDIEKEKFAIGIHLGGWDERKRNVALRLNEQKREQINKWIDYPIGEMRLSKR